ncbi:MAG TPA: 2-C-methyl-D-erythritol 2,4-cyclodiphosphate synthase, partial [Thermoanaerobaculia bacterium]|nr:2-C-methyl-D-erythritol 2,4-cyclodiphosphate synthase [Thermoanaerobaculia bacterium]
MGSGYDIHRLVPGRPLFLGGERIDHPLGLEGHSDADVLLHALADAILGAAGLGDIGEHFPPGEERWRGIAGPELLGRVVAMARGAGWRAVSCDLTLLAEAPRLAPYRSLIRDRIAGVLGLEVAAVGLKATTNEGL